MMVFASNVRRLLAQHQTSAYAVALSVGMDPARFNRYINGKRPITDDAINQLCQSPLWSVTESEMRAWRAADEYTPEELAAAHRLLSPEEQDPSLALVDAYQKNVKAAKPPAPAAGEDEKKEEEKS